MLEQRTQRFRLAVAPPSDVAYAPVVLDLDEMEDNCRRPVEIDELHRRFGFTETSVGDFDIQLVDLPVLSVDKRIAVEFAYFAMGVPSVPDDQACERRLKIAPNRAVGVERQPLGAAALVSFVNAGHEGGRRT